MEIKDKHIKKFDKAIRMLNEVIADIKKDIPEAMYYLDNGDSFNILSGDSHDAGRRGKSRQDRVMHSQHIHSTDCGGW